MTAAINIQCVPTPLIAVKRGKSAQQKQTKDQTGITDENQTVILDETATTLVNES